MEPIFWLLFAAIVIILLVLDLGFVRRRQTALTAQEGLKLSLFYVLISVAFGIGVTFGVSHKSGYNFFTGYLVEKSLSLDNLFVIAMVFAHFNIPRELQRRVLIWGILGALLMRAVMIYAGVAVVNMFHPALYFLGAFLVLTGARMLFFKEDKKKTIEEHAILQSIKQTIPVTDKLHGNRFFAEGMATPLLLALVFIEFADAIFAVDSVPAVLAITTDPFVVYTSNIFAILGLRALYFALADMLHRFAYMKYALALVLVFIGGKIFLSSVIHISSLFSLAVTLLLLAGGVLLSLHKTKHP